MGELVEVPGQNFSNLWAGQGSWSSCMNNCNVAIFLTYLSAVFRLVHVFGRRKPTMQRVTNQSIPEVAQPH